MAKQANRRTGTKARKKNPPHQKKATLADRKRIGVLKKKAVTTRPKTAVRKRKEGPAKNRAGNQPNRTRKNPPKKSIAPAGSKKKLDLFHSSLSLLKGERGGLIPLLQAAQETYGYIPEQAIMRINEALGIPVAEIFGVITFYSQFRLKPLGKYLIKLCDGTACHVNGSERISVAIEDELKLGSADTTADGLFTLQKVACLGCCSLSPVIMINNETYGRLTPKKTQQLLKEYKAKAQNPLTA